MKEQFYIKISNPFYYLSRWFKKLISKERCLHEYWNMDNQIKVIECIECGKRAWIKEYTNIFKNEKQ